jgi:hypothetical protein
MKTRNLTNWKLKEDEQEGLMKMKQRNEEDKGKKR